MFQISSIIQNLRTLADGTWRIQIDTQELTPDQATQLMELHRKQGWFLFKENEFVVDDVPTENAPEFKGDKTPSKRLRAVLFVYWKECTIRKPDFNTFYRQWMEQKIETIKKELPNDTT